MSKKNYGFDMDGNAMRTQVAVVRNYLEENPNNRVTQKFVTDKWGFTRLSAIIFILKDDLDREGGKQIVNDRTIKVLNRFGNVTHPKEYWIEAVENPRTHNE